MKHCDYLDRLICCLAIDVGCWVYHRAVGWLLNLPPVARYEDP